MKNYFPTVVSEKQITKWWWWWCVCLCVRACTHMCVNDRLGKSMRDLSGVILMFCILRYTGICSCQNSENVHLSFVQSFPDGSVVKKPSANAGATGLIPDLGRSHLLQSDQARVLRLLSLQSRAQELQLLKPECPRACARQQEKPLQRESLTLQLQSSPRSLQLKKSPCSNEDPAEPKIKMNKIKKTTFVKQPGCTSWRRQWHPTPVLLPGKSHGWRSLLGCSPWGR